MSIEYEINRISTNVRDTLSAISEMGGEVPEGATSDDMASSVRSIPVGAKIDDTTSSTTTTYSSSKIEEVVTNLNEANAAQNTEINKKANNADLAKVAKSGSYDDLTAKPTIPTVPTTLPNPNALTFTGAVNDTYDGNVSKSVAIPVVPEALKNPNKLILSGAVTAEYDGSTEVSVDIPAGSVKTVAGVSPDEVGNVALTAGDVGAVSMELLLEILTVSSVGEEYYYLDLRDYDAVLIETQASTKTDRRTMTLINVAAGGMLGDLFFLSGFSNSFYSRTVTVSDGSDMSTGSKGEHGYIKTAQAYKAGKADNTVCIPRRIWGIKRGMNA